MLILARGATANIGVSPEVASGSAANEKSQLTVVPDLGPDPEGSQRGSVQFRPGASSIDRKPSVQSCRPCSHVSSMLDWRHRPGSGALQRLPL